MKRGSCPVEGCPNNRGQGKLVCYACWGLVPKALQRRLYGAWNDGDGFGTPEYETTVGEVLDVIEKAKAS